MHPDLRKAYVHQMKSILKPNGVLAGLLFDADLNTNRPPFGGSKTEYETLFQDAFKILRLEKCNYSHESRMGRELFFEFQK